MASNPTTQVNSNWLPMPSNQPVEIGQMPAGSSINSDVQDLKLNNPTFTFSADAFQPLSMWYPSAAKLDPKSKLAYGTDLTLLVTPPRA
ncbi:hypothetical protein ACFPH7_01920 [Arcanobacterium bovis]